MSRWTATLLVTVLAAGVLAGCVKNDSSGGEPNKTNVRQHAPGVPQYIAEKLPDPDRQGNEVTIAVNPKDPKNIVGGAKDYYPPDAGECVWDGVYVTHDAGATPVQDRSFDGSPWRQKNQPDPSKVNYATQFWCTTDPVAYFATDG